MSDAACPQVDAPAERAARPESEARKALLDLAHGKTGEIPPEILVEHVLDAYGQTDWPVQRGALEALLRRHGFLLRDELRVVARPQAGAFFGFYQTGKSGRAQRPYRTLLESIRPLKGSCDCPDYLVGALGACKHILAVLEDVAQRPRRLERALAAPPFAARGARLVWDPICPLAAGADWMERVRLLSAERGALESTAAKGLHRWFDRGEGASLVLKRDALQDAATRAAIVQDLEAFARQGRRSACAEPALGALIAWEKRSLAAALQDESDVEAALRELRSLKTRLYPYQVEGVRRVLAHGRLLLADDMGLGKTAQAIAACHVLWRTERARRGLLVVPASLKPQWQREWHIFSDAPVAIVEGDSAERSAIYRKHRAGFLLTNYEQVLRDLELMRAWRADVVVLDEAQRIKNWATKTAAYVKELKPAYRLVLTGTPLENRLAELASIMDWVDSRALEPKWRLEPWHSVYVDGTREILGARNLDVLRERLAPCMLRRRRPEILKQLPPRTNTTIPVPLTDAQREAHDELNLPIAQLVSIARRRPLTQAQFLRLISMLTTQRVIANGMAQFQFLEVWPGIQAVSDPGDSLLQSLAAPKLAELREIIARIAVEQERKVVVFSQWRRMLKLAHWATAELLRAHGLAACFFTGHEAQRRRTQNLVDFHDDPRTRVLFATDAGGVGLNLQRAATCCVNLELPWNPAVLEQRVGRIYRIGQKHPIDVYNLVSENSIEARIAGLIGDKRALFSGLVDGASNEVRFERSGNFLAGPQRIFEPIEGPPPSAAEAEDDDPLSDKAVEDEMDAADEAADGA
ncbi:MAG: DEAD/DEAH box helicase [Planctomycetes bacterium]|nr:DEAD/DEAH box helicase [Planctomycetota bacterium]